VAKDGQVLLEYQALDLAENERRDLVTLVRIQAGLPIIGSNQALSPNPSDSWATSQGGPPERGQTRSQSGFTRVVAFIAWKPVSCDQGTERAEPGSQGLAHRA